MSGPQFEKLSVLAQAVLEIRQKQKMIKYRPLNYRPEFVLLITSLFFVLRT